MQIWNPNTCVCDCDKHFKIDEYLNICTCVKSITDGLVITCDEVVNTSGTILVNSNDKKETYKMNYYILHTFLLVTILFLIIVTICY